MIPPSAGDPRCGGRRGRDGAAHPVETVLSRTLQYKKIRAIINYFGIRFYLADQLCCWLHPMGADLVGAGLARERQAPLAGGIPETLNGGTNSVSGILPGG
ncbi:MAG: hypothetical protein ACJAZ5_000613 [Alloalcanivorax venustensis]|jgi:hypothetical protein